MLHAACLKFVTVNHGGITWLNVSDVAVAGQNTNTGHFANLPPMPDNLYPRPANAGQTVYHVVEVSVFRLLLLASQKAYDICFMHCSCFDTRNYWFIYSRFCTAMYQIIFELRLSKTR